MDNAVLDKLREERDQTRSAATAIAEGENFNPEDENYVELKNRAAKLDGRIQELADLLEKRAAADTLDATLAKAARRKEAERRTAAEREQRGYQTRESWGEQFTRSEIFTDYRGRGTSAIYELEAGTIQTRALPTGISDLVAAGFDLGKTTVDVQPPPAPTPLLDSVNRVQVGTNAIEFVAWSHTPDPGAQVVAEKASKPSVEFSPDVTSDTLDTIAVWTQLTRQLIEDATAVRDMINGELQRDVLRKEESEAAAAVAAATLPTATGEDLLAAIRVGMGVVQEEGYLPNAVLLNPADWAALDITVMGGTLNGPMVGQNFWGLRPIPASSQAEGTAIVGDFQTAITQFYRSAVGIYITDSHSDTFIKNVFTLLAERRSLTAVVRPQALVEVAAAEANG